MPANPPSMFSPQVPKHLQDRFRELRATAESRGLTQAEDTEYLLLRRLMSVYEQAMPMHQTRVAYEKKAGERLRELEADAQEIRERAEFLQGLRPDPPVPRKQVFHVRLTRRDR